ERVDGRVVAIADEHLRLRPDDLARIQLKRPSAMAPVLVSLIRSVSKISVEDSGAVSARYRSTQAQDAETFASLSRAGRRTSGRLDARRAVGLEAPAPLVPVSRETPRSTQDPFSYQNR